MSRARDRGFTLVELLVALGVLALLAGLLLAGTGTTRAAWRGLTQRSEGVASVAAAQTIVRARLEELVPWTRYDASAPYADIQGKRDVLFWLGPPPPSARPQGLSLYRLSQSTGAELVLSVTPDLAPIARARREDRVLLTGVASVEFAYFGVAPPDRRRAWRDDWVDNPRPPELVRIRVAFAAGDPRRWPDLVIAPVPSIDTACVLNIATGACKGR